MAVVLLAGLMTAGHAEAHANLVVTLEDVTFTGGGTASGSFLLDAYGYISSADITSSAGTSLLDAAVAGYSYTGAGSVPNVIPFDTIFELGSTADYFSLVLTVGHSVEEGGLIPLVLGSGSGDTLAGSYEACQESYGVCSGLTYLDGRLVTGGFLYAPEPATLSLLGFGSALLPLIRRRRRTACRSHRAPA